MSHACRYAKSALHWAFSASLLLCLTSACSSDSPKVNPGSVNNWPVGATLPPVPDYIPDPVRSQVAALEKEVATALCDRATPCCQSLNTSLSNDCVEYSSVAWVSAHIAKGSAEPGTPIEYAFNESFAGACREQLALLESGCGFQSVRSSHDAEAYRVMQAYCMASLSVKIAGQPWQCMTDTDCIPYGDELTCTAGQCVNPVACEAPIVDADADAGVSSNNTCVVGLNDVCLMDGPRCASGLSCKGDVCLPLPVEGEACAGILDCADGLHCVPSIEGDSTGAGVCLPLGPRGQVPCTENWQCKDECVSGFCDPRADTFCVSPY